MKKLLHIISTPRGNESNTLKVSSAFLEVIRKNHKDCGIDELNIAVGPLVSLTKKQTEGKYMLLMQKDFDSGMKKEWEEIEDHINRFLSADTYLLSVPMWNLSIPYYLKQYIDIILQPKYLFYYTEKGPVGLAKNKKMIVIVSCGGDYRENSPVKNMNFIEPYLRSIFGLAGITDITFIYAQPMDALGPGVGKEKVEAAKKEACKIAEKL